MTTNVPAKFPSMLPATSREKLMTMTAAELMARGAEAKADYSSRTFEYLAFDGRFGKYSVANGTDEPDPYPTGSKVYFDLFESGKAWVCWKNGEVVDTVACSLFDPLPSEDSLTDHGPYNPDPQKRDGWSRQLTLRLRDKETGKQYQLRLSSKSAWISFGAFWQEFMEALSMHEPAKETPVLILGAEAFKSNGNKNFKPIFQIVGWEANPEASTQVSSAAEDVEEAVPASRRKK